MLNDWILTCVWGGINSRLGNYSHLKIDNENEAKIHIDKMIKHRRKRGYELITNFT